MSLSFCESLLLGPVTRLSLLGPIHHFVTLARYLLRYLGLLILSWLLWHWRTNDAEGATVPRLMRAKRPRRTYRHVYAHKKKLGRTRMKSVCLCVCMCMFVSVCVCMCISVCVCNKLTHDGIILDELVGTFACACVKLLTQFPCLQVLCVRMPRLNFRVLPDRTNMSSFLETEREREKIWPI